MTVTTDSVWFYPSPEKANTLYCWFGVSVPTKLCLPSLCWRNLDKSGEDWLRRCRGVATELPCLPLQPSGMAQMLRVVFASSPGSAQAWGCLFSPCLCSECVGGSAGQLRIASGCTSAVLWGLGRTWNSSCPSPDQTLSTAGPHHKEISGFCIPDQWPMLKCQLAEDPKIQNLNAQSVKTD